MEVVVNGKTYHAAADDADVARCYVCEETANKFRMVRVGPVKDTPDVSIWRCEDCDTGSPKWVKHYMHKSSVGHYYKHLTEPKQGSNEQFRIGKAIVDERKRQIEAEIAKRLAERGNTKSVDSGRGMVAPPKKAGAGARSAVVVQKTRMRSDRNVKVSRVRRAL